jgi:hypothetical protein
VSLLESVGSYLTERAIPHAIVGATALAFHGVSRSTFDQDLLTTEQRVLEPDFWHQFDRNAKVEQRRGDAEDPLAGVVRIQRRAERNVDLVIGRHTWQDDIIARASPLPGAERLRVVGKADLVLLKLYAGGSQDRWDISQLLQTDDSAALIDEVNERLPELPRECTALWLDIVRAS